MTWLMALGCELAGRPIVKLPQTHMRALDKVRAAA